MAHSATTGVTALLPLLITTVVLCCSAGQVLGEIVANSNCTSPNATQPTTILLRADKVAVSFSRPSVHGSNASLEFTNGSAVGNLECYHPDSPTATFHFVNSAPNGGNSSVSMDWVVYLERRGLQEDQWHVDNKISLLGEGGAAGVRPSIHHLGGIAWSFAKKGYRCSHVEIPFGGGNLKVENLTLVYNTGGNYTLSEEDYDHCLEDPPAEPHPKPLAWWAVVLIVLGTLASILILVCCVCCILCALGIKFWEGVLSD